MLGAKSSCLHFLLKMGSYTAQMFSSQGRIFSTSFCASCISLHAVSLSAMALLVSLGGDGRVTNTHGCDGSVNNTGGMPRKTQVVRKNVGGMPRKTQQGGCDSNVEMAGNRVNNWWSERTYGGGGRVNNTPGRDVCVNNTGMKPELEGAGAQDHGFSERQNHRPCGDFEVDNYRGKNDCRSQEENLRPSDYFGSRKFSPRDRVWWFMVGSRVSM